MSGIQGLLEDQCGLNRPVFRVNGTEILKPKENC